MKIQQIKTLSYQDRISQYLKSKVDKLNNDYFGILNFQLKKYSAGQYSYIPNFRIDSKIKFYRELGVIFEVFSSREVKLINTETDKISKAIIKGQLDCNQVYRAPSEFVDGFSIVKNKPLSFILDCSLDLAMLSCIFGIVDVLIENLKETIDSIWQQIDTDPIPASYPDYPRQ